MRFLVNVKGSQISASKSLFSSVIVSAQLKANPAGPHGPRARYVAGSGGLLSRSASTRAGFLSSASRFTEHLYKISPL